MSTDGSGLIDEVVVDLTPAEPEPAPESDPGDPIEPADRLGG